MRKVGISLCILVSLIVLFLVGEVINTVSVKRYPLYGSVILMDNR